MRQKITHKTLPQMLSSLLLGLLIACQPSQPPDLAATVAMAIASTLTAQPTPTPPPTPRLIPSPTPTQRMLSGLFCEYRFCIGHPSNVAFYDVQAVQDQRQISQIAKGMLIAYREDLFLMLSWQEGETPQAMLNALLDVRFDTATAQAATRTIAGREVLYLPLQTTATLTLPRGALAAWSCGERAFAWKTYVSQPEQAETLLHEALSRFECEGNREN